MGDTLTTTPLSRPSCRPCLPHLPYLIPSTTYPINYTLADRSLRNPPCHVAELASQASQITMYDVKSYYNQAKNAVLNLSEMEAKVREATNDDPWYVFLGSRKSGELTGPGAQVRL